MRDTLSTNCPSCSASLAYTPSASGTQVVNCPRCGTAFEAQAAKHQVAPATPIRARVVAKVIAPGKPTPPRSLPAGTIAESELILDAPEEILEGIIVEAEAPSPATTPPDSAAVPGKPRLPSATKARPKRTRPVKPNTTTGTKQTSSNSDQSTAWKKPAVIGGGGLFAAAIAWLVLSLSGVFGNNASAPVQLVENLDKLVAEYVQVLKNAKDSADRRPAADRLAKIEPSLNALLYEALACDLFDDDASLQPVKDKLLENASLRSELISLSREVSENQPEGEPLRDIDQRLRDVVHVIEQHLTYSLRELSPGDSPADQTCASSIAVKRRMVAELQQIDSRSDMTRVATRLQSLVDELNRLAEAHASTGRQISVMAFEYEGANRATDETRVWLASHIRNAFSPNTELRYTLDEVQDVVRRMDMALRSSIPTLATTAGERIAAKMNAGQSSVASMNSTSAVASLNANSTTRPQSPQPSSTPRRSNLPSNTLPSNQRSENATAPSQSPTSSSQPSYAGASSSPPDSSLTSRHLEVPTSNAVDTSSAALGYPTPRYSGPNSLQIKILNSDQIDVEGEASRFSQKIAAPQNDNRSNGTAATMSFVYSGSLHNAAKAVTFGKVEICDSQSRTLFVVAGQ